MPTKCSGCEHVIEHRTAVSFVYRGTAMFCGAMLRIVQKDEVHERSSLTKGVNM